MIDGHGTRTVQLATGWLYGIAPNADTYLIKASGNYYGDGGKVYINRWTPVTAADIVQKIIHVVKDKKLEGKAVVSVSICECSKTAFQQQQLGLIS